MRTFIHYDKAGHIISVAQAERLAEGLDHPFVLGDNSGGVLEVQEATLSCHEIHDGFVVNVTKKKLKKK